MRKLSTVDHSFFVLMVVCAWAGACAGSEPTGATSFDDGDASLRDVPTPALDVGDGGAGLEADADAGDVPSPDAGDMDADVSTSDSDGPGDDPQPDPVVVADLVGESDVCASVPPCAIPTVGTRCENDVLVSCRLDTNDCFTELRVDCALTGDGCFVVDSEAECREDPTEVVGETCADARPLTAGVHSLTTAGFINDYNDFDACGSLLNDSRGPDVVYVITLQAGASLTVSMESSDTDYDVVAAIGDACPNLTSACRDYSDESIFLYPEVVSVTNTTGAPRLYYVVADGDFSDDAGPLTMTATVSGP